MAGRTVRLALGAVAILAGGPIAAFAQQSGQTQAPPQRPAQQQAAPQTPPGQNAPASAQAAMPDEYKLNTMIRTAIIALNQANQTGNYTVLRDLGTASFRMSNDAARLAEVFSVLRRRQIDLSPMLFFTPKLVQQPQMDPRGLIRLVGFFETAPERVNFDIYYLWETGQWRLFGVGVVMSQAEATAAIPQQSPSAAPGQGGDKKAAAPTQNAQPVPPKAAAAEKPAKPAASAAKTPPAPKPPAATGSAPAAPGKPDQAGAENRTSTNTARVRLGQDGAQTGAAASGFQSEIAPAPKEKAADSFLPSW